MYKNKKILGLITARGGSKSIPKKNIKELAGKPLIYYTIKAAQASQYLTRTIISSDDEEIIGIARELGAEAPFVRPAELAQDQSTSVSVAQHALKWLEDNQQELYDYLMILQPTSPLRTTQDIDETIKKAVDTGADSVMSMVELDDFDLAKLKIIKDDLIEPLIKDEGSQSGRRQDGQKVYKRNCAIYLTKTELIKRGDLFGQISRPYIMPAERSVDINTAVDFELAEYLMTKKYA